MQLINKWVVKIHFTGLDTPVEFEVNDNYYMNVLNHVAKLSFAAREVFKIEIWQRRDLNQAVTTGNYIENKDLKL